MKERKALVTSFVQHVNPDSAAARDIICHHYTRAARRYMLVDDWLTLELGGARRFLVFDPLQLRVSLLLLGLSSFSRNIYRHTHTAVYIHNMKDILLLLEKPEQQLRMAHVTRNRHTKRRRRRRTRTRNEYIRILFVWCLGYICI